MKEFHRRLSLHPSQDASLESERNGNALTELRSYPSVGERRGGGWGGRQGCWKHPAWVVIFLPSLSLSVQ